MWQKRGKTYNKFGNKRVEEAGRSFGSQLERAVFRDYRMRELTGEIKILATQQHIHFYLEEVKLGEYWPDFTLYDLQKKEIFWGEAKGDPRNPLWVYKSNLWRAGGPGDLEIWTGRWEKPYLKESITPRYPMRLAREDQCLAKVRGMIGE